MAISMSKFVGVPAPAGVLSSMGPRPVALDDRFRRIFGRSNALLPKRSRSQSNGVNESGLEAHGPGAHATYTLEFIGRSFS